MLLGLFPFPVTITNGSATARWRSPTFRSTSSCTLHPVSYSIINNIPSLAAFVVFPLACANMAFIAGSDKYLIVGFGTFIMGTLLISRYTEYRRRSSSAQYFRNDLIAESLRLHVV